jgi:hypothetical protein
MKQETLEEFANKAYPFYGDVELREAIELGAKWQQEQYKNRFSKEEVTILLQNIIYEIEIRKQNIIYKSETMSVHLLEGGCMAFESSQDVVKEQVKQFKNK